MQGMGHALGQGSQVLSGDVHRSPMQRFMTIIQLMFPVDTQVGNLRFSLQRIICKSTEVQPIRAAQEKGDGACVVCERGACFFCLYPGWLWLGGMVVVLRASLRLVSMPRLIYLGTKHTRDEHNTPWQGINIWEMRVLTRGQVQSKDSEHGALTVSQCWH